MMEKSFTTHDIAQFCQVTMAAVTKWIEEGKLPAHKTPGGHRRVQLSDFLNFLKKYRMPIPTVLQSLGKMRVLIVDDDPEIVYMVKRALDKVEPKLEIESASDGFEAGQKVAGFLPDLVILDLKLPGVDGFKICQDIKSDKTKKMKVLAVTGYDSPEFKDKILGCGADEYLVKPFEAQQLMQKVTKLLG